MTQPRQKNDQDGSYEFLWLRITVVVVSLGLCAGKALIWLHL